MEINTNEEKANFIEVNNRKGLKFDFQSNVKEILNKDTFKDWLTQMKSNYGEDGIICYCVKCNLFFYFENLQRKNTFNHNDGNCSYTDLAEFCEYCGELYFKQSFCCMKKAFTLFEREVYTSLEVDCQDYCFMMPIISFIFYFSVFFHLIMTVRKKNKHIKDYEQIKRVPDSNTFICVCFTMSIVYSLVFFIPHIIIYFGLLIFIILTRKQVKKDRLGNFIRY